MRRGSRPIGQAVPDGLSDEPARAWAGAARNVRVGSGGRRFGGGAARARLAGPPRFAGRKLRGRCRRGVSEGAVRVSFEEQSPPSPICYNERAFWSSRETWPEAPPTYEPAQSESRKRRKVKEIT